MLKDIKIVSSETDIANWWQGELSSIEFGTNYSSEVRFLCSLDVPYYPCNLLM